MLPDLPQSVPKSAPKSMLKPVLQKWRSSWSLKFYARIYLAMLGSLVLAVLLVGLILQIMVNSSASQKRSWQHFSEIAGDVVGPPGRPPAQLQASLERWGEWIHADIALYGPQGAQVVVVGGNQFPKHLSGGMTAGFDIMHPSRFSLQLPDRRWLLLRDRGGISLSLGQIMTPLAIALAVALGSYPLVRRLTKRLERLQSSVEALGEGQLSTRVLVEGNDEVAQLAISFNRSALRIEALMAAQKSLLANASHELRSPLARIRMAVELMQHQAQPAMREELSRNINELDQLIDEILLSSRLEAASAALEHPDQPDHKEEVELTALLAEECARVNADLTIGTEIESGAGTDGSAAGNAIVRGEVKLLRRLLRNLLENARRHGGEGVISARLQRTNRQIQIDICDRGKGVPEDQRERIFEPFYRLPGASEGHGGVGLGLSLVKQIALRHQAQVSCLPHEGGGSCFRVCFRV